MNKKIKVGIISDTHGLLREEGKEGGIMIKSGRSIFPMN